MYYIEIKEKHIQLMKNPEYVKLYERKKQLEAELSILKQEMYKHESKITVRIL